MTVPPKSLIDLKHGWAVTVHRAQGSEFPAVVAVVPAEAGGLLSRPLVYTAFTRAQRHLSVVPVGVDTGLFGAGGMLEDAEQERECRLWAALRCVHRYILRDVEAPFPR